MAFLTPDQMDFTADNLVMIIAGLPGVGKTTLACSTENSLVIDVDNGMKRVKNEHRRPAIYAKNYEELLADLQSPAMRQFKTLIIDTCGALIELMKEWAERQPGGAKKGGGISIQGFGIVKSEFSRLFRELRQKYNCILIFHTHKEKDKDGNPVYDIQCEGATKQNVWQPVDLGGYMQIIGTDRYLCFKPTQEYTAKKCYGVADMYKVPELSEDKPNNFIDKLMAEVKANIAREAQEGKQKQHEYMAVMEQGRIIIEGMNDAKTTNEAFSAIGKLPVALTSRDELRALFKAKITELGIKWNPEAKAYE